MKLAGDFSHRIVLIVCLTVMAGGLVRYGWLWSNSRQWFTVRQQAEQLQQDISRQASRLADLTIELKEKSAAAATFDRRIPADKSAAELWRALSEQMNACGLTEQRVEPAETTLTGGLAAVRLKLQARGSAQQIFEFIRTVEQMERLIRFESAQLSADPPLSGQVRLQAEALVFYYTAADEASSRKGS